MLSHNALEKHLHKCNIRTNNIFIQCCKSKQEHIWWLFYPKSSWYKTFNSNLQIDCCLYLSLKKKYFLKEPIAFSFAASRSSSWISKRPIDCSPPLHQDLVCVESLLLNASYSSRTVKGMYILCSYIVYNQFFRTHILTWTITIRKGKRKARNETFLSARKPIRRDFHRTQKRSCWVLCACGLRIRGIAAQAFANFLSDNSVQSESTSAEE